MLIETCRPVLTNRCRVVCRQRGRQHRSAPLVVQDPDIFEANQGLEDLSRVSSDGGAFCFLDHT
jgi:hypothetical protein